MTQHSIAAATLLAMGAGGMAGWYVLSTTRRQPSLDVDFSHLPKPRFVGSETILEVPGRTLVTRVGHALEDLDAYLEVQRLRRQMSLRSGTPLVAVRSHGYDVLLPTGNDAIRTIRIAASLTPHGASSATSDWLVVDVALLRTWESQTRVLEAALRGVPTGGAESRRARPRAKPADQGRMLADMEHVSRHYAIPMRLFEATGRVNTDYIDADGRLHRAAWHKHSPAGHVVLYRGHDRVLTIRHDDPGWRLTEDAMRSAHESCSRDARNGALLPPNVRPPDTFSPEMQPATSVAYAGRLLRDLIDRCHGDSGCASQAIASSSDDGGSVRLEAGVRRAGLYAARALEHVGAIARLAAMERERFR